VVLAAEQGWGLIANTQDRADGQAEALMLGVQLGIGHGRRFSAVVGHDGHTSGASEHWRSTVSRHTVLRLPQP
jgi:hypothetical protein